MTSNTPTPPSRCGIDRRTVLQAGAAAAMGGPLAGSAAQAQAPAVAGTASPHPTAAVRPAGWRNWSGLQQCQPSRRLAPANEAELAQALRGAPQDTTLRCVGAGHSFTPLVPTDGWLVSLDQLSGVVAGAQSDLVQVQGGTRLAVLSRQLDALGLALPNLPDVDVQSYAGAISTATHGTGRTLPALHAQVQALRLVTARGEILECSTTERPELLAAARVSLGSLGVITQAQVRVVPAYNLHRHVWLEPVQQLLERADALSRKHRNFEFYYLPFTGYAAGITHDMDDSGTVQTVTAADEDMLRDLRRLRDWLGVVPALRRKVAGWLIDETQTEDARNRAWKLLSTQRPTRFNETEYHVPREAGVACVREVIAALEKRNEVFFPLEFRFVAADDAWLSPFYQRPSCSIAVHAAAEEAHGYLLTEIGPILRRHGGRPHWGKLHNLGATELAGLYPRFRDFQALRQELDPHGRFLNAHLRHVFGVSA